jgi:AcrR family transcriptional regulator
MPGTAATLHRETASERIRRAAIALFNARGYHGTPIRALARIVRVEAASLYYHFPSKQEILTDIFARVMDDLLAGLQRAMQTGLSAEERLRAVVRFHVLFHVERQAEASISRSELRSLTPANLRRIIAKRDRYETMLRTLLLDGVRSGAFEIRDVPLTATAILTMCSGVSDWFSSQGRLTADAVADAYADMVQQLASRGGSLSSARASARRRRRGPRRGSATIRWTRGSMFAVARCGPEVHPGTGRPARGTPRRRQPAVLDRPSRAAAARA